jgi:hypothetical protein
MAAATIGVKKSDTHRTPALADRSIRLRGVVPGAVILNTAKIANTMKIVAIAWHTAAH